MARLGALFSGGKDSTFAIHEARRAGHQICCLLTVCPVSAQSMLLHHPAVHVAPLQAGAMGVPWYGADAPSDSPDDELDALDGLVKKAIKHHSIQGLLHGGLRSRYQRRMFERLCMDNPLEMVAPLWGRGAGYLQEVVSAGFRFMMVGVSADGLDDSWLGRIVTMPMVGKLEMLAERYGLSVDLEGGEAETLVVDCPLFRYGIMLCGHPVWDGYRGVLQVSGAMPK